MISTHLIYWSMGSVNEVLSHKLFHLFADFWFLISTYLLPLFSFISTYFFRLKRKGSSLKYNSSSLCEQKYIIDSNYVKVEPVKESDYRDSERDGLCEKEATEFCFKFKFPTYEEFSRIKRDNADFVSSEAIPSTSISNSEFMSNKSCGAFIEEMEPISFKLEEVNTEVSDGSSGNRSIDDEDDEEEYLSDKEFNLLHSEAESVHEETYVNSVNGVNGEELIESMTFTRDEGETIDEESRVHAYDEKESSSMDSDKDGFLSYGDFGGDFELDPLMDIYGYEVESHEEISESDESQESDGEDSDIMEELRNLEEDDMTNWNKFKTNYLSENGESSSKPIKSSDNSEIPDLKNSTFLDEDTSKLETLWEHQELMEQLKMELKKVRATGLPTILEESESESPKIMDDLKPWKIDDKFQHGNPMGELHKFYKSYRERMRKFDILNYQKMYAIGFLQLKDPQSISTKKTSVPEMASENLYLYKSKKYETDPTKKFINELLSELEVAYVGQMCLSWEFLHWQYGMALELWESDPRGIRRYNEVAGEFQQFQVLVQRFIEDEPFQGPRVQNYIKHRRVLRNLLQVPVIREDRKKARRSQGDDYSITSDLLVEIVEESMRILWRFIGADKDTVTVVKNQNQNQNQKGLVVDLQDPAESEILKELRKDLLKKERKLKDQLRSANCILKKFQKCGGGEDENPSDQVLFFFSQVDMKLVSRVLNMSKLTTDQLAWCRNKLNTISFINRKIHVEPSFCLFPC